MKKMASLIVKLHELVTDYIKKANNQEIAGKIGTEVLLRSKEVVKKHMWVGEDACMFHVALLHPIVSRELIQWNKIAIRRMKASTPSSHPWQICFSRDVPTEVYNVLKLSLLTGKYGDVLRSTRSLEYLKMSTKEDVCQWMTHVISKVSNEGKEAEMLCKQLKDGAYCEVIVDHEHPLIIKYSKTQENVRVVMFYGCWNAFFIPQHIL